MDRMTSMMTFVKVVEAGGFAAASRKLDISPSTVTTQIQALEERLGARLLNRSTRKISLTDIGKAYHDRCLHILAEADDADNIVQALRSTPRGTLRINASIATPMLLAPVMAEFTALYPDVKVSMTMSDSMVDLIKEGIDLAIRTMPVPDSNLVMRRVGSFRLLICGAPDYLAARGTPRQPQDLLNHNCLSYSFSAWGSEWRFDTASGQQTVQVSGNLESNSTTALKLAAVLGQGLILLPDFLLSDEIKSGKLVPVLNEICGRERPINAIYPHRHHLSANVRSFLELTAKHFRGVDEEFAVACADIAPAPAAANGAATPMRLPAKVRANGGDFAML